MSKKVEQEIKESEKEVTPSVFERFKGDFSLFIEAGFIAVKQLDETSAMQLFQAAHVLNSDSVIPDIGLGYIALNKLEVKRATEIFTQVIKIEPEHHLAQVFLGICYLLKRKTRKQGEELIKEMEGKTTDPSVINLCKLSLEWSKKDLSGSKAPFFQR